MKKINYFLQYYKIGMLLLLILTIYSCNDLNKKSQTGQIYRKDTIIGNHHVRVINQLANHEFQIKIDDIETRDIVVYTISKQVTVKLGSKIGYFKLYPKEGIDKVKVTINYLEEGKMNKVGEIDLPIEK